MFKVAVLACILVLSTEAQNTKNRNDIPKDSENDVFLQNNLRREFYVFPAYHRGKFGKRKVGYLVFSNMDITKPRFLSLQDKRFREGLEIIKSPGIYRGKSAERAFSRLFASKFYRKPSFNIRQGIIRPKSVEKLSPLKAKLEEEKIAVVKSITRGETQSTDKNGSGRGSSVLEVDPNEELTVFDSGPEDSITDIIDTETISSFRNSQNIDKTVNVVLTKTKSNTKKVNDIVLIMNKASKKLILNEVRSQNKTLPVDRSKLERKIAVPSKKIEPKNDVIENSQTSGKNIKKDESINKNLNVTSHINKDKIFTKENVNKNLNVTSHINKDKILTKENVNKNFTLPTGTKKVMVSSLINVNQSAGKSITMKTDQKEETTKDNSQNGNPLIISKGMLVGKRVDKNVPLSSVLNVGNYIYLNGQNNSNDVSMSTQNRTPQISDINKDLGNLSDIRLRNSPFSKSNGLLVLERGNNTKSQSQLRTYIIRLDNNNNDKGKKSNGEDSSSKPKSTDQRPAAIIVSFSDLFDAGLAQGLSRTLNVSLVENIQLNGGVQSKRKETPMF